MRQLTRRSFFGHSIATAAAVAVTPRVSRAESTSANEKINVAVVGAGGRGSLHIPAYLADSRTVVATIVEVDEAVGNRWCDKIESMQGHRPKFIRDIREALDDQTLDAVSIATPNHWHALGAIWAMQAGKDVYLEKPVCHNVQEGAALVAAAEKYKRICQVGTQCRSYKGCRDAMAFIKEGGIGEVKFARGLCYKRRKSIGVKSDFPIPPTIDFDLWSGPATFTDPKCTRQRFDYDWHWQRHYGNGDLGNQGPHQTDVARWGLGIDAHPQSIISYGGRLGYQIERKNPDYVDSGDTANTEVSIYDYGDKCIVFETRGLEVTRSRDKELNLLFGQDRGVKVGVVFYGTDGFLVQRSYSNYVVFDKDMKEVRQFNGGGDQLHYGNFLDCCVSRDVDQLNAPIRDGHLSAGISHLGNISYYLGESNRVSPDELKQSIAGVKSLDNNLETLQRTIDHLEDNQVDLEKNPLSLGPQLAFDNETETFSNSDAANAMLTREYREGFLCPSASEV